MFNSQKINTDSKPRVNHDRGRVSNSERMEPIYFASPAIAGEFRKQPRPEYGNNPNRILEYFRDAMSSGEYEMTTLATVWEGLIDTGYDWGDDGLVPTLEELDHARKVIQKLIGVYNG